MLKEKQERKRNNLWRRIETVRIDEIKREKTKSERWIRRGMKTAWNEEMVEKKEEKRNKKKNRNGSKWWTKKRRKRKMNMKRNKNYVKWRNGRGGETENRGII